ncbi:hypothetical protein [Micromonospora sp. BL4]|uniref:hypothetical protein n=1 Tax=Micromonospora sp. BL4 TaxID=2478710 RepID=UPI0013158660|nr:hypothetical protein [Micromonospora sp. BL4]
MGITGGIACVFLIAVIVAGIAFWAVRYGLGPKKPPPPSDVLEPPQHPRDGR